MKINGKNTPIRIGQHVQNVHREATVDGTRDGRIILDARGGNDRISVDRLAANRYGVQVNGQHFTFDRNELARLTIRGGSGNDRIRVGASVDVPIRVEGGRGDDTIINHANGTRISGGRGNDHIVSNGRDVFIRGGRGNDHVDLTGGSSRVYLASNGFDTVNDRGRFFVLPRVRA